MGYHTWFYKEVDCDLTQGQAKDRCMIYLHSEIRRLEHAKGGRDKAYAARMVPVLQRQMRMVAKDLCKCAVWGYAEMLNPLSDYRYHRGRKYMESDLHDVFRLSMRIPDKIVFTDAGAIFNLCEKQGVGLDGSQRKVIARFFKDGGIIDFR